MSENKPVRLFGNIHRIIRLNAIAFLSAVVLFPSVSGGAPAASYTFRSAAEGWSAADRSVVVSVLKNGAGDASLRIVAKKSRSDTLALSPLFPMSGFQKYRLTARIRVDDSAAVIIPSLACDCLLDGKTGSLGLFMTDPDGVPEGGWNKVGVEFRAPWGTSAGRLYVVAKVNSRAQNSADVRVDDVVLEPIEAYTAQYALKKTPAPLERLWDVHPRLYLTGDSLADLRRKKDTTHAGIWKSLAAQADDLVKKEPPAYPDTVREAFDEQWWQARNDFSMTTLAFAYLVSGEKRYLDTAVKWALATCRYPNWGVGWSGGLDCMAGQNLYGLAMVYDWCHHDLATEVREELKDTMVRRGGLLFKAASEGTIVPDAQEFATRPWPEWESAWLQNHLWVNASGLAAAGFALYGEYDGAGAWISFAEGKFGRTLELLGPDGASHEGINYWSYGIDHLLKYLYLSRGLLGVDHFDNAWFKHAAEYRLHSGIPSGDWRRENTTVDYGDSYRRDHTGPDYILHALAAEYRDGHAQWLAGKLDDSGAQLSSWKWLDYLWYDPTVKMEPPAGLPTMHHFTDMGIVSARSGWNGDEAFVYFQCGPYIGHKALFEMPYCASSAHHTHPDRNQFVLHGAGEWLIRDDGNRGKYTSQHNTLVIDGGEQLGGGDSIFDGRVLHALKAAPRVLRADHSDALDHIAGDATAAYPPETGLKRFRRHLLFLKPDILIVIDDIRLAGDHDLELRFHPEQQEASLEGTTIRTAGAKAKLRMDVLTPCSGGIAAEKLPLVDRRYVKNDFMTVRLKHHGDAWKSAVAFSWSRTLSETSAVTMEDRGGVWLFKTASGTVRFDWKTGGSTLVR